MTPSAFLACGSPESPHQDDAFTIRPDLKATKVPQWPRSPRRGHTFWRGPLCSSEEAPFPPTHNLALCAAERGNLMSYDWERARRRRYRHARLGL